MPIYEYECKTCNKRIEKIRKMSEREDLVTCPTCKNEMKVCTSDISRFKINWIETKNL